ncbi:hypothetical protein GCG54_00005978 [Colletotrichum gloeosporioides]|uniref:Uncharacterized protein n=1 Tax=Colletotrichum gloeosporioides TaxID=474922 RepID=A0A8H4CLT2_COLGL|nr:uncharacterized protein GCG54_00005978 [Colletotrichum gloeosporioides]KAF3806216.1 hypothetical protein GCG54_00005978 [Colletotrichum gloeosporioides]
MPAISSSEARLNSWVLRSHLEDSSRLSTRQAEEPTGPLPPTSPNSDTTCIGWGCLTEAQQAGIIVCIAVVFVVLAFSLWFFLKSKRKKKEWTHQDFVLVRKARRRRRRVDSRASSVVTQPSIPFRHNGLSVVQQPPPIMITPPTFFHIPPPPPPPVPVYVPTPMPIHPPQTMYPVVYQPYPNHGVSIQGGYQNPFPPQRTYAAPVVQDSGQGQQVPQPPSQNIWSTQPWTHPRGDSRPQEASSGRPSLARRLFEIFSTPVGRASTIASSDSNSLHEVSTRDSHQSRLSMTSVTDPPSPETRRKPEASQSAQNVASPCGATVASDDYVLSAERPDGLSGRTGKKQGATIKKDSTEFKTSKKVHTTTEETRNRQKRKEKAKLDVKQDIPTGQSHHRDEPRHSPRKIKPMRRYEKNLMEAKMAKLIRESALKTRATAIPRSKSETSPRMTGALGSPKLSENHKVVKRKTETDRDGSPKKSRKDPMEVTLRTVEMVGRLSTGDLSYPIQGTHSNQVTPQRDPPKIQEYSTPYHNESDSTDEFDVDSPPPSPPRPVHQGGGRYAPDQLRRVA